MPLLQRFCTRTLLRCSTYQQYSYVLRSFGRKAGDSASKPRGTLTPLKSESDSLSKGTLLRPLGFTILVGGTTFAGCAIWQYESLRKVVKQMKEGRRRDENHIVGKAGSFRDHVNFYWNNMQPGKKVIAGIIGVNLAVFFAWKLVPLRNVMTKYFVGSPFGQAPCWSMLFSNWSHFSGIHIFVNMYVLWSCASIGDVYGKEQFFAFYTTAGMFSAFVAYAHKFATKRTVPSLGASGAILAVLGAIASEFPDAQMSIALVNQIIPHSFSAKAGILGIVCFDVMGLLLRWRILDHAAHLGGVLFGIWYVKYGHTLIWGSRESFVKMWHNIRGKP